MQLISNNDESDKMWSSLQTGIETIILLLNVVKTKEIIVAFRMTHSGHFPLHINGTTLETMMCTDICSKYTGLHIKEDITGTFNTTCLPKKALVSPFPVPTDWSKPPRPRNKGTVQELYRQTENTKAIFLVQLCTLMMFLP